MESGVNVTRKFAQLLPLRIHSPRFHHASTRFMLTANNKTDLYLGSQLLIIELHAYICSYEHPTVAGNQLLLRYLLSIPGPSMK